VSKGALKVWLVAVGILAVLVAAGCGGGDDETTALTKSQFISQGNALCKEKEQERLNEINKKVAALKPNETFSDAKQTKMVETIIIPNYEELISEMEELGAPEGDEAQIEKITAAMKDTQKKLEEDPEEAIFSVQMFEKPNKLLEAYGLKSCVF
jgi:hypothetical protein